MWMLHWSCMYLDIGWVDSSSDSSQLLLAKVEANDGLVQVKLSTTSLWSYSDKSQVKYTIVVGATFQWTLQILGDNLDSDSSPLAHLPQVLDTARKVSNVMEGVQLLPINMMWDLPVVSTARLMGRIKALSGLPLGISVQCECCLVHRYVCMDIGWDVSSDSDQLLLTKVEAKGGLVQVKLPTISMYMSLRKSCTLCSYHMYIL